MNCEKCGRIKNVGLCHGCIDRARALNEGEIFVKIKNIDEIILFILEEDQAFSDDDTYSSDNFSSQIVKKLEHLKKG